MADLARIKQNVAKMASMNAPEADIDGYIASEGVTIEDVRNFNPQQTSVQAPQAGFVQRVGEALANRVKNVGESTQATLGDKQTWGELAFQGAGQGIGAVGDVLGNALISGYRYLPESDYGLGEGAALIGSIPTGGGDTVKDEVLGALQAITNQGRQFAAENPRAARNLGAAGNIAAAVIPVKGAAGVGRVGVGAGKATQKVAGALDALIPKPQNVTGELMGETVNAAYKVARDFGGTLTPKYTKNLSKLVVSKVDEAGATLNAPAQKILRGMSDPEGVVRQGLDLVKTLDGKPLDLAGFEAIDKTLTGLRYGSGTSEPAAMKLGIIQRQLRDLVDNAKPNDIAGGAEGFEAYRKATALASKKFRINELEQMTANAFATQQPVSALKGRLSKFLADKSNLKGFNETEIAALKEAAKTGTMTEWIRAAGGRLPTIATMATNPAIAPAVSTGSTAVRSLSARAMAKKMQEINNLIATGQANRQSLLNAGMQGAVNALGKGGSLVEKAYSGSRGNIATLGLLEQLQREQERNQINQ